MSQLETWPLGGATISDGGTYRYLLWRDLTGGPKTCLFVMCNPSTAHATADDPTVRRCKAFAGRWGYDRLEIVNLFAFRTADVDVLKREYAKGAPVVGPENDRHVVQALRRADRVVLAWGAKHWATERARDVGLVVAVHTKKGAGPFALRITSSGHPEHPLYVPSDVEPVLWEDPCED